MRSTRYSIPGTCSRAVASLPTASCSTSATTKYPRPIRSRRRASAVRSSGTATARSTSRVKRGSVLAPTASPPTSAQVTPRSSRASRTERKACRRLTVGGCARGQVVPRSRRVRPRADNGANFGAWPRLLPLKPQDGGAANSRASCRCPRRPDRKPPAGRRPESRGPAAQPTPEACPAPDFPGKRPCPDRSPCGPASLATPNEVALGSQKSLLRTRRGAPPTQSPAAS